MELVSEITSSSAFLNGFWLFVGIVAGALIQYFLGRLQIRYQAKNAFRVMRTEIELNLDAYARFKNQVSHLKDLLSSGQVVPDDLYLSMQEFDYSAVSPLVQQGYFHFMLGPEKAKHYFEFMRFFNNGNARVLTDILKREHERGKSIEAIRFFEGRADELSDKLRRIGSLKLKRGLSLSGPK